MAFVNNITSICRYLQLPFIQIM